MKELWICLLLLIKSKLGYILFTNYSNIYLLY